MISLAPKNFHHRANQPELDQRACRTISLLKLTEFGCTCKCTRYNLQVRRSGLLRSVGRCLHRWPPVDLWAASWSSNKAHSGLSLRRCRAMGLKEGCVRGASSITQDNDPIADVFFGHVEAVGHRRFRNS